MEKKEFLKKKMFINKEGNVIVSYCMICFANNRKYSEGVLWRFGFKYIEKVAEFY